MHEKFILDIAIRVFFWACGRIASLILDAVLDAENVEQKTKMHNFL